MTPVEQIRLPVRGVELVGDARGSGPDLLWGHGLTSSRAAEDELGLIDVDALAEHARVVRYDACGHGESASSPAPERYHWRSLAEDQLALADRLGIDRYVAGGASMGCGTALHAALLAPERIRALVLAIPPTAWAVRAAQADQWRATADLVVAGDHVTLLAAAAARPQPDPLVDDPVWSGRLARLLATTDPERLARVYRGAAGADLPPPDAIATIRVPVLILAWTGDPTHPIATAARLQELLPHAELAVATTRDGIRAWTGRIARFVARLDRAG